MWLQINVELFLFFFSASFLLPWCCWDVWEYSS